MIGIDLGPSQSAAAILKPDGPVLIENRYAEAATPSLVGVDTDGQIVVGRAAVELRASYPDRCAALFNGNVGSDEPITLGGQHFTTAQLSSAVLKSLKADAEAATGIELTTAVICVPSFLNDVQRRGIIEAGSLIGLSVGRVVNAPTAAAVAYCQRHATGSDAASEHRTIAFLNASAESVEVAIVEYFDGVIEVLGSAGEFSTDDHLAAQSADAAAEPSQRLGQRPLTRFDRPMYRAFSDAGVKRADIDQLILVGDAANIPQVADQVDRLFGKMPTRPLNAKHAVVEGAAYYAGVLDSDQDTSEFVLNDVSSWSVGIELPHMSLETDSTEHLDSATYLPILHRNEIVPVQRVQRLAVADATRPRIRIFQGESRRATDNILLGEYGTELGRSGYNGNEVDVCLAYDANGVLDVDIKWAEGPPADN